MREIVLDTETTGLDPFRGHRVIEIGCVELINKIPSGEYYHVYVNPQRDVPQEAFNVHGIATDFLQDKPLFKEVADAFIEFIAEDPLVIHNAGFDMKFLNYELDQLGKAILPMERAVDTLTMARRKFPGSPSSLDALCRRFSIDLSSRTKHGALLDSELLADVYLELCGGRQNVISFDAKEMKNTPIVPEQFEAVVFPKREFAVPEEEFKAHQSFIDGLPDAVWKTFVDED